jgi:hypothetical protein
MLAEHEQAISDINSYAIEFVNYDPADEQESDCQSLRDKIIDKILSLITKRRTTDQGDEIIYIDFFKAYIKWDLLIEVIFQLLSTKTDDEGKVGWRFNPGIGKFMNYMLFLVRRRRYNEEYLIKKYELTISLDEEKDDFAPLIEIIVDPDETPEEYMLRKEMENSLDFAKILEDLNNAFTDQDLGAAENKKRATYFPGFFTYFRTSDIKIGTETATAEDYQEYARKYGEELFRWMLIAMLEFLMEGAFSSINDVIENPLREHINITQVQQNLGEFFGSTRQTISKYIDIYQDLEDNLLNSIHQ